ncbi:hypothetical protein EB796_006828 [Bugula neritina]|uniref:Uncharacterized protein n=1 Tax=Bugula neritina TaxID=10212 RepID=A0A7J7KB91_BUGNE|nr:hypothetical protein EB796_006828 [Bugula neritina]
MNELKKNLGKDKIFEIGSPPMKNIEKAIDVMQDIAYYVNEVKRDRESLDTITMIEQSIEDLSMPQGTRLEDYGHLLKDGELKVRFHDDNRELRRYIFLFDKVMLMCKSRIMDFLLWGETYSYKNALVLHNYKLEDVPGGPIKVLQWRHSFMLVEKENKTAITFFSKNEEIKKKWIDSINMAMDNYTPEFSKDNGHDFIMHTFTQPTECDACEKLLAGCFYQGYLCSNKKTKAHKHCIKKIVHNKASSSSRRQVVHPVHAVRYKAKYAYQGLPPPPHGRPSLKFSQDDTLEVENTDDQDWWMGSRGGHHGYFPSAYVEKLARPG